MKGKFPVASIKIFPKKLLPLKAGFSFSDKRSDSFFRIRRFAYPNHSSSLQFELLLHMQHNLIFLLILIRVTGMNNPLMRGTTVVSDHRFTIRETPFKGS
jgi:hypothetical protein